MRCLLLLTLTVAVAMGDDCPQLCTFEYDPQCGSDGRTYGNPCALNAAKCDRSDLTLDHAGECKDVAAKLRRTTSCSMMCTADYRPVCGSDGKTYSNLCALDVAQCLAGSDLVKVSNGECEGRRKRQSDCTLVCPMDYSPLCGSDGYTYSNRCALDAANCMTNSNVKVQSEGKCQS